MTLRDLVPRWSAALGTGALATALLALVGVFAPASALHGWLIGFATVGGLALGCAAWLAIHATTGGRWGTVARPALLGGAAAIPLAILLILPLIVADRVLYPWAADPNAAGPDVAALYLNTPAVALRSLALLGGLSLFAWYARRDPPGLLPAALALVLYGGLMNLSAFDWLLSLDPRYTSSAFGMQVIAAQLAAALCWAILRTEATADDPVWADLAGLLLATVLGEAYLILMTFVVHWYGDLPDQAAWFLARSEHGWGFVEIAGVALAIGPILALLFARVRRGPAPLRWVAATVLTGVATENVWLVAPHLGPGGALAALCGLLAIVAFGAILLGVAGRRAPALAERLPDGA